MTLSEATDMRISREDKKAMAEALGAELKAGPSFFAGFAGMRFADADAMRNALRPLGARFRVVRNSVAAHAVRAAGLPEAGAPIDRGPTAVVTLSDPEQIAAAARAMRDFAKDRPCVSWKGGFAEGAWIAPEGITALAAAGSRRELAQRLAGGLYSAYARLRYALDAIIDKNGAAQAQTQA